MTTAVSDGDICRVMRVGNKIRYYHNNELLREIEETNTANMIADFTFYQAGARIYNPKIVDVEYQHGSQYFANVTSYSGYYPFGMLMPGRSGGSEDYCYGMNGMEKDDEVKGTGNSYTTPFRQYDSRLGRWLSLAPMESSFPFSSPYVAFNNNPILYVDPMGDSSVVDSKGYMIYYDPNDTDLRVFMQGDAGKLSQIGVLGGKIKADGWFDNLLVKNSTDAFNKLLNPKGKFNDLVKENGAWDYKNRSPDNQSSVKNSPYHILGIAFFRGDGNSRTGKGGDLGKTKFVFQGKEARPEDLNNLHFGAVFQGMGTLPEWVMRYAVGAVEQDKWDQVEQRNALRDQGQYWIDENPNDKYGIGKWIGKEKEWINPDRKNWESTWGDNPTDYGFIGDGIKYYKNNVVPKIIEGTQ